MIALGRRIGLSASVALLLAHAPTIGAQASIGSSIVPSPTLTPPSIAQLENDLLSPTLSVRSEAVHGLSRRAREIDRTGVSRLVELLQGELDNSIGTPTAVEAGEEGYGEYLMMLTQLVSRFTDPRIAPLLARQGIGFSSGSRYQVAMAGDASIPALVSTWNSNVYLRPAVVVTMALTRFYADSTGHPLSDAGASTIDEFLLRASTAPEPWIRRAFVDAVEVLGDGSYLPLVEDIAQNDPASIDSRRYIAQGAALLIPKLQSRRDASSSGAVLQALIDRHRATCQAGWISKAGICSSLEAKLTAAQSALSRGQADASRAVLNAYIAELTAQRGKAVTERAYILLSGTAMFLSTRA